MNMEEMEAGYQRVILELWWLKARRAAMGHNKAAEWLLWHDRMYTLANVCIPVILLALSTSVTLIKYADLQLRIPLSELIIVGSGCLLALSYLQTFFDFKVRSLVHRQASCEFEAMAQEIEAAGIQPADTEVRDISRRLIRIQRASPHVPAFYWKPAREAFGDQIANLRARLARHRGIEGL